MRGCVKSGAPSFFLQKSPNIGGLGLCRVKDFCIFAPKLVGWHRPLSTGERPSQNFCSCSEPSYQNTVGLVGADIVKVSSPLSFST